MYTPTLWEQGHVIRMSGSALELTYVASIFSEDMLTIALGVTHKLVRHWGTTRGVGIPILICTHLHCGNRELSSEWLDLLS